SLLLATRSRPNQEAVPARATDNLEAANRLRAFRARLSLRGVIVKIVVVISTVVVARHEDHTQHGTEESQAKTHIQRDLSRLIHSSEVPDSFCGLPDRRVTQ